MSTLNRDDPRAVATRASGYYLCIDTDDPCWAATEGEFCAHVWNWVRGWDAAHVWTLYGSVLVDADPHGLLPGPLADLTRTLSAAHDALSAADTCTPVE